MELSNRGNKDQLVSNFSIDLQLGFVEDILRRLINGTSVAQDLTRYGVGQLFGDRVYIT